MGVKKMLSQKRKTELVIEKSNLFFQQQSINCIINKIEMYNLPFTVGGIVYACQLLNNSIGTFNLLPKNIDTLIKTENKISKNPSLYT
jgi:hypothetical protein